MRALGFAMLSPSVQRHVPGCMDMQVYYLSPRLPRHPRRKGLKTNADWKVNCVHLYVSFESRISNANRNCSVRKSEPVRSARIPPQNRTSRRKDVANDRLTNRSLPRELDRYRRDRFRCRQFLDRKSVV